MQIVTGYEGTPHVTAWQDRDLNQGIFGSGTYILSVGSKMAASIISNNEIRIADGAVVMQGCLGVIQKGTYDTIAIDNGSQGLARHDLICAQYSKNGSTGVESMSLVVIKGTAASSASDPAYTSGDIQNGDTLVQVPLYRVVLSGLTVTGIERLVDEAGNITEGGAVTNYSGSASIQSLAGFLFTTVRTELLPAGTYLASFWIRVEEDLQGLTNSIEAGLASFRGAVVAASQYDVRCAVTAFFTISSATNVYFRARQNSGSAVDASYGISIKKVG